MLSASLLASCREADKPKPAPENKPAISVAVEDPPLHVTNPGVAHAKPRASAPPAAVRQAAPENLDKEHAVITVSDISIPVGGTAVASVEVAPKGEWKINEEYPIRVSFSGAVAATPPETSVSTRKPGGATFQVTSGGIRVDIPMAGASPGHDTVTTELKFGVCSASTCLARTETVEWRAEVATAPTP